MARALSKTTRPLVTTDTELSDEQGGELEHLRGICNLGTDESRDTVLQEFYQSAIHHVNSFVNYDVRGVRVTEYWASFPQTFNLDLLEQPGDPVRISWYDENHNRVERTLSGSLLSGESALTTDWVYDASIFAYQQVVSSTPRLSDRFTYPVSVNYTVDSLMDDQRVVQGIRNHVRLLFSQFYQLETPQGALLASTQSILSPLVKHVV